MNKLALWTILGLAGMAATAFVACKLDLDEGLIPKGDGGPDAGGTSAGGSGGGGLTDSGFGGTTGGGGTGGTGGKGDGGPCDADPQCASDSGCLEGKCAGGQCLFELCPAPSACQARSCDVPNGKCSDPVAIQFKASSIELDQPIGCGGVARRCIAGFGDLLFVATADGTLHAWRTTNPKTPEALTVDAPTFTIERMIAAETRLLILSSVDVGSGKLQAAWVDPPSSPQSTTLGLSGVGVNFPGKINAAFNGPAGSFFLVDNDSASIFSAAYIDPPLQNNATISQYPSTGLSSEWTVVAAAGTRLVGFRVDSTSTPVVPMFSLVANGGTQNAQKGSEQSLGFETPTSQAAHFFATGFDGSVLWSTNAVYRDDAGTPHTTAVVLRWPLAAGSDTFDGSLSVEIANGYPEADWNTQRRGPLALIDSSTALVAAAYPSDAQQTVVRSVTRSGSSLSLGSATAILPFAPGAIGVAANRKYGFVLTPQSATPLLKTAIHVFAPSCG